MTAALLGFIATAGYLAVGLGIAVVFAAIVIATAGLTIGHR